MYYKLSAKVHQKLGINFDELSCVIPSLTFVIILSKYVGRALHWKTGVGRPNCRKILMEPLNNGRPSNLKGIKSFSMTCSVSSASFPLDVHDN